MTIPKPFCYCAVFEPSPRTLNDDVMMFLLRLFTDFRERNINQYQIALIELLNIWKISRKNRLLE
jgi:hypothetical protein